MFYRDRVRKDAVIHLFFESAIRLPTVPGSTNPLVELGFVNSQFPIEMHVWHVLGQFEI